MEGTYIIGKDKRLKELGGHFIERPNLEKSDKEIHDWLINQLSDAENIAKLVIEIGNNPELALKMGYHFRLSIEEFEKKVMTPILFISNTSLSRIITSNLGTYSQILATKGTYFSEMNDPKILQAEIDNIEGLSSSSYLTHFLKIIHIQPNERMGRHSLANVWGAYAMDKAAGSHALSRNAIFMKGVYFKYVLAFNNLDKLRSRENKLSGPNIIGNINTNTKINSKGKRILLIDDEADKGWEKVLRKIFDTTSSDDFVVIKDQVEDFSGFSKENRNIMEYQNFDLYLIDLRLNGLNEEDKVRPADFSGMKVLNKIKSINQGKQIIILTASNKAWNLKALLKEGASGYYMKESPEYNFTNKFSMQNYEIFKEEVEKCFKRGYLQEIYTKWEDTKDEQSNNDEEFIEESDSALDIAWELIKDDLLDFGFLTLFQSVESYANEMYEKGDSKDKIGEHIVIDKTDSDYEWKLKYNEDTLNGSYFSTECNIQTKNQRPKTLFKVSCLFHFQYEFDNKQLKKIGRLNKIRNDIAHPNGTERKVSKDDIIQILECIRICRRYSN